LRFCACRLRILGKTDYESQDFRHVPLNRMTRPHISTVRRVFPVAKKELQNCTEEGVVITVEVRNIVVIGMRGILHKN
jgi:histone H3/H4